MANNRDNFNLIVIEKLRSRVANKCSNPECRINTTGPKEDEGILNAGVAAHICAAAPGGPRYDVEMSKCREMSVRLSVMEFGCALTAQR